MFHLQVVAAVVLLDTVEFVLGSSSPAYTWPLGVTSGNAEVIAGLGQPSSAVGCRVGTAGGHPSLPYDAIHFVGEPHSYVDVEIGSGEILDDFAFSLFVFAQAPISGTLLHLKNHDLVSASPSGQLLLSELTVVVNTSHLTLRLFGPAQENYGLFEVSNPLIADQWVPLSISHTLDGEITIATDDQQLNDDDDVSGGIEDVYLGQPTTVRLGNMQSGGGNPFTGRVTCFSVYDGVFAEEEFAYAIDSCQPNNWNVQPSQTNMPSTCPEWTGYFASLAQDSMPSNTVTSLDSMTTCSAIRCGDVCLKTTNCVTFSYNKVSKSCILYPQYHTDLEVSSETRYYKRRDVCC